MLRPQNKRLNELLAASTATFVRILVYDSENVIPGPITLQKSFNLIVLKNTVGKIEMIIIAVLAFFFFFFYGWKQRLGNYYGKGRMLCKCKYHFSYFSLCFLLSRH